MAATLNLIMRGGNTFTRTFRFQDADGADFDVSDARMVFTAEGGTTSPLQKDTDVPGSGFAFVSGEPAQVSLSLTADETDGFAGRKVTYEVEYFFQEEQTTLFEGTISTKRGVNSNV